MNFMLISYLDDIDANKALCVIREVKERFPKEGIRLFLMEAVLA